MINNTTSNFEIVMSNFKGSRKTLSSLLGLQGRSDPLSRPVKIFARKVDHHAASCLLVMTNLPKAPFKFKYLILFEK